nr:prothymosin alpha [Pogona vitticeps]
MYVEWMLDTSWMNNVGVVAVKVIRKMSHQDELGLSTWTLSSILNRTLKGLFDEVMESLGSISGEWFLDALDAELERLAQASSNKAPQSVNLVFARLLWPMIVVGLPYPAFRAEDRPGPGGHVECGKKAPARRRTPFAPSGASLRIRSAGDGCLRDLKEKKEVVEETENGRDAPANGNAENEENGEQEAENEVDEEEEEVGDEEEDEEEGEEEDGDEDEEPEGPTGKRAAEDDEDDDVDPKKQKTEEDD